VTARRALGYQQVLAMLAGDYDDATARERTVYATRRFARRQMSWFRRDPRIAWLPADAAALPRALDVLAARQRRPCAVPASPSPSASASPSVGQSWTHNL
jgi:tRNA dimethylallyltransferase